MALLPSTNFTNVNNNEFGTTNVHQSMNDQKNLRNALNGRTSHMPSV